MLSQLFCTEFENILNVRAHKPAMKQRIQRQGVLNVVACESAAALLLEGVFVDPLPIRSANLFVHEPMRRLPGSDARAPAQWQPVDPQAVINQRALAYHNRFLCFHAKMQPWRRDGIEVRCVCEKGKQVCWADRQPKFSFELVNAHA